MKLLVVGHSFITPFAQSKYAAMMQMHPELKLRLIVPHEVPHTFMTYKPSLHAALDAESLVVVPAWFNRSHMTRILHPGPLVRVLKNFVPHHIHIEEDPHSAVGVELVSIARCVAPRATLSFFIWDNLARPLESLKRVAKKALTSYSLSRCDLVVCGNLEAQRLLHDVKGWKGSSTVLPQVGVDAEEYLAPLPEGLAERLGKTPGTPLIGFLGRLVPEKGIRVLLEALTRLTDLKWGLVIVGKGPLKEELTTMWRPRFGDRVTLLDAVPHAQVSQYLRCLDVFVLPPYAIPTWKEQFSLTLAQAMMAGVACIGSSSGAIPEVLGPGGLTPKEGDVDELTHALDQVLRSEDLRREMGARARAFAAERYETRAVAGAYLSVFQELQQRLRAPEVSIATV